jgi:hypothetical protein
MADAQRVKKMLAKKKEKTKPKMSLVKEAKQKTTRKEIEDDKALC